MEPRIERTADGYRLECEISIPHPLSEVFPFFSDHRNLEAVTPEDLDFTILTPGPVSMEVGLLIDYRIKLGGIPFRWQSEITVWEPPHRFVDEQRKGPYRKWIHEHRFEEVGNTTRMIDRVDFRSPGGALAHRLFVNRKVRQIFLHRTKVMGEIFPDHDRAASGAEDARSAAGPPRGARESPHE
jgi:ligand-binding SRPBCC domain-containing protein